MQNGSEVNASVCTQSKSSHFSTIKAIFQAEFMHTILLKMICLGHFKLQALCKVISPPQ